MLGDIGLKTRGWGNVSVENNHIDVFIFEFADVLHWLSKEYNEPRFSDFAEVISTSMRQLLPYEGHMCGIAKVGYYPEVVQHTNGITDVTERDITTISSLRLDGCFFVGVVHSGTCGAVLVEKMIV